MPGIAVTVALEPAHAAGAVTLTVGNAICVTIPEILVLGQLVTVFVIITE